MYLPFTFVLSLNSNTTNVKVKLQSELGEIIQTSHSNTTNVKVKLIDRACNHVLEKNSNTTNVKVKQYSNKFKWW